MDAEEPEMFYPMVSTGIEKPDDMLVAEESPNVSAFEKIAINAGKGKVFSLSQPAVFQADNVFDLKFHSGKTLESEAVFAQVVGSFNYEAA